LNNDQEYHKGIDVGEGGEGKWFVDMQELRTTTPHGHIGGSDIARRE
jgi:hypothetical protein